jgi:hypothetical protein
MRSSSSRARASPLSVALSPSPSSRWVYLAHTYPYTYSDLQRELRLLEDDPRYKSFVRRRDLCTTIGGNRCDLLTITNFTQDLNALRSRVGVVLSSRVHPGESNASYMMRGAIRYLTSDELGAHVLRNHFVFKVPTLQRSSSPLSEASESESGPLSPLQGRADAQPRRRRQRQLPLVARG